MSGAQSTGAQSNIVNHAKLGQPKSGTAQYCQQCKISFMHCLINNEQWSNKLKMVGITM